MGGRKPRYGFDERQTDALSHHWDRIQKSTISVEFDNFDDFARWAWEAGYDYGKKLIRLDPNGPFSPDNCVWRDVEKSQTTIENQKVLAQQWDNFITPIRERYAPYLQKAEAVEPPKREMFCYEHPDLVREGIV